MPTPSWQDHDWTVEEVNFVATYLRTGNGARTEHQYELPAGTQVRDDLAAVAAALENL